MPCLSVCRRQKVAAWRSCARRPEAARRAFARGELDVAAEIRRRFVGGAAAREVSSPAAVAAARAAGQAASIPHMGAHALGAAAYAARAAGLAAPDRPEAVSEEICWQLGHITTAARAALRQLPPVGENASGPLAPGLLASGLLGSIIRDLQAGFLTPTSLPDQGPSQDGNQRAQFLDARVTKRLARHPSDPRPRRDSRRARRVHPLSLPRGTRGARWFVRENRSLVSTLRRCWGGRQCGTASTPPRPRAWGALGSPARRVLYAWNSRS